MLSCLAGVYVHRLDCSGGRAVNLVVGVYVSWFLSQVVPDMGQAKS